jgi:hypothetical protein
MKRQFYWLLIAILVCGSCSATAQEDVGRERERNAIEAIEALGGIVQWPGLRDVHFAEPIKDKDLELLNAFPFLESLTVDGGVSGSGFARLQGLTKLSSLNVNKAELSQAGLSGLVSLQELHLAKCAVADLAMAGVERLSHLSYLELSEVNITDAAFMNVSKLTALETLNMFEVSISDAGLACLGELPHLKELYIAKMPITEAGLMTLRGARALRRLHLDSVHATHEGIARVKAALPYTLIDAPSGPTSHIRAAKLPTGPLYLTGMFAALMAGTALFLRGRRLWVPAWAWKLGAVLGLIAIMAIVLMNRAEQEKPVRDGDPYQFWINACHLDVGAKNAIITGGCYLPRDG